MHRDFIVERIDKEKAKLLLELKGFDGNVISSLIKSM